MPQRGTMAQRGQSFWSEKISIEPDLGDQRKSTFKALPRPPTTPKRVLMKYRFTALIPALLSVGSFVLVLVVVLAGTQNNLFSEHYLVALNTTKLGQDVIRFETANLTSPAPSTTSSPTSPLSPLNPFSSDSPLNPSNPNSPFRDINGILDPLVNNVTSAIDDGISGVINGLTKTIVTNAGIKDHYLVYVQKICSGSRSSNADSFRIDKCRSWDEASKDLSSRLSDLKSSVMIGRTTISIPLLANLTHSLSSASSALSTARTAAFVFLIIALTTTLLYILTTIPGIVFPHSRLLLYINVFVPILANISTLLATIILTIMVILTSFLGNIADAVGVTIVQGRLLLLFLWLSWALLLFAITYWITVWFVEVRRWAFKRRNRTKEEIGDWRGVFREVLRDIKGKNE